MKDLLNNAAESAANVVLFCVGCIMAGIGLSVVFLLALFALSMAGLALIASPFLGLGQPKAPETPHAA